MLNKSLTIVLPVHNAESRLRKNVSELLELASELTAKFGVLIIDDGSTDATFEVAEELASHLSAGLGSATSPVPRPRCVDRVRATSRAIRRRDRARRRDADQLAASAKLVAPVARPADDLRRQDDDHGDVVSQTTIATSRNFRRFRPPWSTCIAR